MPEDMPTVKMFPAVRWTCACGRENFDRATEVVFDAPEDEEAVKEALGAGAHEGVVLQVPDTVTCRQCLRMYKAGD